MRHEITHGFNDEGRLFDKDGNKVSWWTNETIDEFNKRNKCIIQQYSKYILTQVNL
jgi:predicted metalloendopeptidase